MQKGSKSKGMNLADVAKLHGMTAQELMPQLRKGIRHEYEHTTSKQVARRTALDHLVEFPDYYDRLDKIEKMHLGGDMSKHLAPNGKPSNLNHEQWHLVRTPEFKAWFGDWENDPQNASKVVDENGEPLVVYHGTIVENAFNTFDYDKADLGFHFGTKEQAQNRIKSKKQLPLRKSMVNPFFLNIRILFEMTDVGEWEYPQRYIDELMSDNIIEEKIAKQKGFLRFYDRKDNTLIRDYIKSKYGNSVGFVYNNKYEGEGKSFIALSNNQIKLADGSNTTFYSENPDIRFKKGGRTIAQTPAPISERIYGSKTNPKDSASDETLAKSIKFNDRLEKAIENKVKKYNQEHPTDKVGLSTAKAIVRRGMGAYSKSHRPTISGGMPNSRQAWGLARLNKFLKKKSGLKVKSAYVQDDDLLKYARGGKTNQGDCYQVTGRIALDNSEKAPNGEKYMGTPKVVHGEVEGQGKIEGLRYGHAWIEDNVYVYDFSNGRDLMILKEIYYYLGKVKQEKPKLYKYTFKEARNKMIESGHFGSWDLITESGL